MGKFTLESNILPPKSRKDLAEMLNAADICGESANFDDGDDPGAHSHAHCYDHVKLELSNTQWYHPSLPSPPLPSPDLPVTRSTYTHTHTHTYIYGEMFFYRPKTAKKGEERGERR